MKLCTFCSKPMKKKGHLCGSCVTMMNKINDGREKISGKKTAEMKKGIAYKISQSKVKFIIDHVIKSNDSELVIKWFNELHYYDWFRFIPNGSRIPSQHKKDIRKTNLEYASEEKKIPKNIDISSELPYVAIEFKKPCHYNQELVSVRGTYTHPIIIVKCKSCEDEYACRFSDFKVGKFEHYCRATISSGELAVGDWLKSNNLLFKTQFDTFKVINPHTKYRLPFDFELTHSKVIIEVHGDQHYKFVQRFHQTIENFKYQQWKDNYKKKQAEQSGYTYIEINYTQIKNGSFKDVLSKQLTILKPKN